MPELNGLELAELIEHQTKKLVFTTVHANFASNPHELNTDDFLLKPISQTKFEQTVICLRWLFIYQMRKAFQKSIVPISFLKIK